jgi:hypothetical protein
MSIQTLFDLPMAIIIYICYTVPVYFLSGLQPYYLDNGYFVLMFTAIIVLYCISWRQLTLAAAYMCESKVGATAVVGTLLLLLSIPDGVTLNAGQENIVAHYLRLISPTAWTVQVRTFYPVWIEMMCAQVLAGNEFFGNGSRDARRTLQGNEDESQLVFREQRRINIAASGITTTLTREMSGAQVRVRCTSCIVHV